MKKFLKRIYYSIPFKRQMFSTLKFFFTPSENIYKHLHFKEYFTVKINKENSFKVFNSTRIENEIFWEGLTGNWEKESMKLWIKLSSTSNTILDIGANTGIYSLVSCALNPNAKVYAFEPHPHFYEILNSNKALNSYNNLFCLNQAMSDKVSKIEIEDYTAIKNKITVDSNTIDHFIESYDLEKIDLIKIDVETFEPYVVKGFINKLSEYKPNFLIEILTQEIADELNSYFKSLNYSFYNIDEYNGIRKTSQLEKSDSFNYLIINKFEENKIFD